ncbi:MAG: purine-nucleoside phosphorylase [Ignavibacteriae bacterium]|nr:purine-nucleoside phosphorylase [Ignavibacteria bacterium]MBI3364646.1 purine-nucleoside phosphorylase [Ignavibacteriota bacterium]
MTLLRKHINQAVAFIRKHTTMQPEIGIILGTGLGGLVKEIRKETVLDYDDIPHFPVSTVESHHGKLIFGTLSGKNVVAMQGRFHYYEGYTMQQVTFPVRVMSHKAGLGATTLLISNAAGGMNPRFRKGDLMIITDHINLQGDNPLIGPNDDDLGPRFPDMSEPYDHELISLAQRAARDLKIKVQHGVFVAVQGPNLETRAEYRFLRGIGADAVGMSTVPENIVANHMGMRVLGMSIITDECFPDTLKPVTVEEVIAVANKAEPKLTAIMKELVKRL